MATLTLKQARSRAITFPISFVGRYNKFALMSTISALLFLMYFLIPHIGVMYAFFSMNVFFVFIAPLAALIFSAISLRQITKNHDRGIYMSVTTLILTSLYFITALAIPFVLVGCYVLYTYIL